MLIKDCYRLASSHTFELKEMQEVTVDLQLTKVPPCYHTLLTGRVFYMNIPIEGAVVKIFDCMFNPLLHTVTNDKGVFRFKHIAPGQYNAIATAEGFDTSETINIKIKENKVITKSFELEKSSISTNGIIYGKVREEGSKQPVEGAELYLKNNCGMVHKTTSNRDGQYIMYDICPDKYKLIVKKQGYMPSETLELNVDWNDRINLVIDLRKT